MTTFYVVQHGEKMRSPKNPGLTERGREQAALASQRLRDKGLTGVLSSPLRRARETAEPLAAACGLEVQTDDRLTERMNWDGSRPIGDFLAEWERATADRDFVPALGESSRAAGKRFRDFLLEHLDGDGALAVACHGGVTVDLLRTLLDDERVPEQLLREGVPSGAVTTLHGLEVVEIASVEHLNQTGSADRPFVSPASPCEPSLCSGSVQPGYLLSIDRAPRIDGSPLPPAGVFLDEAAHPKRRLFEETLLLGGAEVGPAVLCRI